MGEIADGMINGDFDCLTGEYLGGGNGFPRTTDKEHAKSTGAQYVQHADGRRTLMDHDPKHYAKGTKAIRKELALLIKKRKKENYHENENVIVKDSRRDINKKYGKGWREQY